MVTSPSLNGPASSEREVEAHAVAAPWHTHSRSSAVRLFWSVVLPPDPLLRDPPSPPPPHGFADAEANFNTMITGSCSSTCWKTTDPYNQTWSRNDYFECQVKAIEAAAKLGLKSVFYVGTFPNQQPSALRDHEDIAFGGDKSFGVSSNIGARYVYQPTMRLVTHHRIFTLANIPAVRLVAAHSKTHDCAAC